MEMMYHGKEKRKSESQTATGEHFGERVEGFSGYCRIPSREPAREQNQALVLP